MRTVTFSNADVAKAVNESCVSMWVNRVAGFHNCSFSTEEWILKSSPDCYSTKNFCTYFCTADKKVLHYMTGYYAPKLFLEELEFARQLLEKAVDGKGKVKNDVLKEMHGTRSGKRVLDAKSAGMELDRKGATAADWQKQMAMRSLAEGLGYLGKVSAEFAQKGAQNLTAVKDEHLSGNMFTEERTDHGGRGKK